MKKHPYRLSKEFPYGSGIRYRGEFTQKNAKGERITFDLTARHPVNSDPHSLPNLWYKSGKIDRVLPSYRCLHTYVDDKDGKCTGKYNPQHKGFTIDFDRMFEATKSNREKLIEELERRAFGR